MSLVASTDAAPRNGAAPALTLAGIAALLASACCVLPLVFVFVGISGAWISQLQRFEPYSPWLAGLALVSLGIAAWRLFAAEPAAAACAPDDAAACRSASAAARRWFWAVALLTLVPLAVPRLAPWFY
jgi:mercuric ion transport protein